MHLFSAAHDAKYKMGIVMSFIITIAIALGMGLPGLFSLFVQLDPVLDTVIFQLIASFGFAVLLCMAYVRSFEKVPVLTRLGFSGTSPLKDYLTGLGVGILMFVSVVVVMVALGVATIDVSPSMAIGPLFLMLLGFGVQGAAEEVMYRGLVLPAITSRYNLTTGIIVSSIGFTLLHGLNPGMTIMPIINLTLFAIFAALYTYQQKNLWGICGMHTIWNFIQGNFFGIRVSGNVMPGGSVLQTTLSETNTLLSGGSFGLEGSLLCSVMFLIAIAFLIHKIKK